MQWLYSLLFLGFCSPVLANSTHEYWVDPIQGNDTNAGTDPSLPFRTITRATDVIRQSDLPAGELATVFLQPGQYDATTGEVFPIRPFVGARLIGLAGPEFTILDGTNSPGIFEGDQQCTGPSPLDCSIERTRLEISGITLHGSSRAFDLDASLGVHGAPPDLELILHDAIIEQCTVGIHARGFVRVSATNVHVRSCFQGIVVPARHGTWTDCSFTQIGQAIFVIGETADNTSVSFTRCRITNNDWGVRGVLGTNALVLESCLVAANFFDGIDVTCKEASAPLINIRGCTISLNGGRGLHTNQGIGVSLTDSILYLNGDDLDAPTGLTDLSLYQNNILSAADPDAASLNGVNCNRYGTPIFRDPFGGDFRLQSHSEGVDSDACGPHASPYLDLAGVTRNVDGDLDGNRAGDLGALEYLPFEALSAARLGETLAFRVDGIPNTMAILAWSPSPLAGTPMDTVYGPLWLEPALAMRYWKFAIGPQGLETPSVPIPATPTWLGRLGVFKSGAPCPTGFPRPPESS